MYQFKGHESVNKQTDGHINSHHIKVPFLPFEYGLVWNLNTMSKNSNVIFSCDIVRETSVGLH